MDEKIMESLRRMVYASMSLEVITNLVTPRYCIDSDAMRSQVKVMHTNFLTWGVSCPNCDGCQSRLCKEDMINGHAIRCSYPM